MDGGFGGGLRAFVKHAAIVQYIARQIVAGHIGDPQRLPTGQPTRGLDPSALGWRQLGAARKVGAQVAIALDEPRTAFRYYLVWITRLEPDPTGAWISAGIGSLRLLKTTARAD